MGNIYRWLTILLSIVLAVGIIYLAHYLIHRYLYGEMHWYSYLANRFRINNIVVFWLHHPKLLGSGSYRRSFLS